MSPQSTWNRLRFWCLAGLVLSCYALYVEIRAESDPNYKPLCDINTEVSCKAVFTSFYGRGFGLMYYIFDKESQWKPPPNGLFGIGFYLWCLYVIHNDHPVYLLLHLFVCFIVNALSIYLGYILFYVLEEICAVCLTIYLINYLILTDSMNYYKLKFYDPSTTVRSTTSRIRNSVNRNQ